MRRLALFGAAVALLAAAGLALVPSAEATSAYSFNVTFGTNTASQLPVTVSLPAPADGSAVTSVTFKWQTSSAPWVSGAVGPAFNGQQVVEAPSCVAGAGCIVDATLPTGTMANATDTIQVFVTSSSGVLGTSTWSVAIQNAKPSVSAAWPTTAAEWSAWGDATVATAPVASTDGVAIKDVRLYDSSSSTALPIAEADAAPWDLTFDTSVLGAQGAKGVLFLMVEDTAGNTFATRENYLVEPPATIGTTFVDGDTIGSTLAQSNTVDLTAAVPDSVTVSTQERDDGVAVTWPAGILGFDISVDGGAPVFDGWRNFAYSADPQRAVEDDYQLPADIPAGQHTLTLTAETSYGAESTMTTHFVIADGANFSPIISGGKTVTSNSIFAVGRASLLTVNATARTSGTWLTTPSVQGPTFKLTTANAAGQTAAGARSYALTGAFTPTKPGQYLLSFCVESSGSVPCGSGTEGPKQIVSKLVTAEYATKLAFTSTGISGGRRVVHATVKDSVKGVALAKVTVQLQRKKGTRWISIGSAKSTASGAVTITATKTVRATYRLLTNGLAKTDMAATSATKSF